VVRGWPQAKATDPMWKITKAKKGWGCGSGGRAPAYQDQVSEFKLYYFKKKKKKNLNKHQAKGTEPRYLITKLLKISNKNKNLESSQRKT
jgi:hypothetical protein